MAAHTALARQLGVTEELLDALYHIDTHRHLFTTRELAALRFAEVMTTSVVMSMKYYGMNCRRILMMAKLLNWLQ